MRRRQSRWTTGTRVAAVVVGFGCLTVGVHAQWAQWGGPQRNFMVEAKGLASTWPEGGPEKLWARELGDGYATVAVDEGRLFTMYRVGEDEFSVALDAKTGKTLWEHKNPSPYTSLMNEYGPGPHATPLVVGGYVYTIGTNMVLHCFEKDSGKVAWKKDLAAEYSAEVPGRGYSPSPLAYKDMLILPVGGSEEHAGQAVVALKLSDGSQVWKSQDFRITHSSPILVKVGGADQLVVFMSAEIAGMNPDNGELLWRHEHRTQYGANLMTPMWTGDDLLFLSAAYDSGSRVIRLAQQDGKTVPEELWYSRKMRLHHTNPVRVGDYVYGSSGDFGPAFLFAVNIKDGTIAWRERGFAKATCLYADGKLILLDEDGKLALAAVSPKGLEVLSECQLLERTAWAAPTLVGKTLFIRDRKQIMALDLG